MKYAILFSVFLASIFMSPMSLAQNKTEQTLVEPGSFDFRLTAGFGGIENPLRERDHIRSPLLPEFSYYGDKLYIENLVFGYSLYESPIWLVDAYGYFNNDGYFFADSNTAKVISIAGITQNTWKATRVELNLEDIERDLSYMAGINISHINTWYRTNLSIAKDITSVHHGEEISLTFAKPMQWNSFTVTVQFGATYKSADISDYYYRLTDQENTIAIRQQDIGDTLSPWSSVNLRYHFNPSWSVGLSFKKTWFDSKFKQSILVEESNYSSGFVGVSYRY
ncbi:MipA/OmpV family protein [Thalassotalea mangrovi]|uniref:MipA/OmpV family protein n=1 Tax=Thalassotalea mangrovi TaxID=2572245 RepID=A0A4U1B9K4_9GAMM|nr:MipA/OmpV family protein [Thalassotalea mangrovi]TKB47457.1 MipA/OmpV family protein [Thalassotalea mangrovi]